MLKVGGHPSSDRTCADDGPPMDAHYVLLGGMSRSPRFGAAPPAVIGGSAPRGIAALTISSNMRRSATEWYLPSNQLSTTSLRASGMSMGTVVTPVASLAC